MTTDFFEMLHQVGVFVGNVFLNERSRLEEFLTRLAPKFTFVLLFDMRLGSLRQFPTEGLLSRAQPEVIHYSLVIALPAIVMGIYRVTIQKQSKLGIQPIQPPFIWNPHTHSSATEYSGRMPKPYHFASSRDFRSAYL